jgi:sec-independent protein translocase protein TatC
MKSQKKQTKKPAKNKADVKSPFIEHILELRRRVLLVILSMVAFGSLAYAYNKEIIGWLLAPAHGEKFIYTSPVGGIEFILQVCFYSAVILSTPIIMYHTIRYIEPLISRTSSRFIVLCSLAAGVLALIGLSFGYFFGLPTALEFLLQQFNIGDITALITIQSYLSFVIAYLAGAALIFQVPLWMFLLNRIRPLKSRTLMKSQRWAILISVIIAALINPSPRPQDLMLLAIPILLSYEVGIVIIWWVNRKSKQESTKQQVLT